MKERKYKKITKDEVIRKIERYGICYGDPEVYFLPKSIARDLKTSRYQVNKILKNLKEEGLVKYVHLGGGCDEYGDRTPPYNGYEVNLELFKKARISQNNEN